ncbi:putative Ni/Fe-hydrogenase B-type cytochrome subunit [Sulfuriferula plumbiphila]|uniref:Putative Ni/Fe-hydrogenase B-type cytochrome subunit n=1 Tax=Sulfuriferula plumbiphila TaxID=171865 RepID=A0A512LBB6_9PROT|nr:Ni/Fe-hydrogenase, b-type cytochrome subunit [Sulfuriferula plumbiphila]BBP04478.1 putative Ni/Fe-hydrogenase B-type cytochrome subunit [Sulfuriferula plumbiphila]GEP31780.1 putative Ni/Fe-hydrogenase B-type cytochrome subunit [Sulfuriferula plumbiphila]
MDIATAVEKHDPEKTVKSVYVYEAPVRLWHWINAFSITVLAITGYFIGSPLPTQPGEASANFLMGYIRFAHFAAAYVFVVGMLGRIYWAVVGNHHARQLFILPFWDKQWRKGVWHEIRWYLFLERTPEKYVGHNPLAQTFMFLMFVLGSVFMIFTGFAMYGEGEQTGSWADHLFGWVIPLLGQSQDVHTWHHVGMWFIITFVIMHVYVAIREDIMSRQSMVSTMISGWRMFKD